MLHLVNGGATLERLGPLTLPGTLMVWDDILVEGPVRPGPFGEAAWRERGTVLERRLGIPAAEYVRRVAGCHAALDRAGAHDAVVLWFEEDLFCQVHLAYLLGRLGPGPLLSLICPARPLAHRTSAELRALFDARQPVPPDRPPLAARLLEAWASPDPSALQALQAEDLAGWPALSAGLVAHLQRFPGIRDGLGRPERLALAGLLDGPRPFAHVLPAIGADPVAGALAYTDLQLLADLADLASDPAPLLRATDGRSARQWRPGAADLDRRPGVTLELTALGRRVLAGEEDRARFLPLDRWLGGVHLTGSAPGWRWAGDRRGLVRA